MKRLLALWLVLSASFLAGRVAVSLSLFNAVDLTYRAFLELIVVPGLQAAAVTWATRRPGTAALLEPWRRAIGLRSLRLVLALDLAVLAAAWLALGPWPWLGTKLPALGFAAAAGLPRLALAVELAAAAALLAVAGWRRTSGALARLATLTLAAAAAVAAVEPITGWIAAGPDRLFTGQPLIVRWLRFYLPLLLGLLLLLLAAQAALRQASAAAARAMDWALAAALVTAAIVVGGFFLHPWLRDPWRTAAWTAGSATAIALLVAGALAAGPADDAPRSATAAEGGGPRRAIGPASEGSGPATGRASEGPGPTDEGPGPTDEGPGLAGEGPGLAGEGPGLAGEGSGPAGEGSGPAGENPGPAGGRGG